MGMRLQNARRVLRSNVRLLEVLTFGPVMIYAAMLVVAWIAG